MPTRSQAKNTAKPPVATQPAQHLAIVALSSAIPDHSVLDRAASYFSGHGYQVTAPEATFTRFQRFAGTDQVRLQALQEVVSDPSVNFVIAARGGYGLSRLLHQINWKQIAKSGKQYCGYSDFTAFNLALLAKTGMPSLHGPSASSFGGQHISSFTEEHFWSMVQTQTLNVKVKAAKQPVIDAKGLLWGGNLAMFCSLLGTPFMPKVKNGILFFEDTGEHPYRLERMLLQVAHSGIMDQQRAVILGHFTDYRETPNDQGFNLEEVVKTVRAYTKIPILTGLPFGHVHDKLTLPFGSKVHLASTRGGFVLSN